VVQSLAAPGGRPRAVDDPYIHDLKRQLADIGREWGADVTSDPGIRAVTIMHWKGEIRGIYRLRFRRAFRPRIALLRRLS
jgi:hypothetical protein